MWVMTRASSRVLQRLLRNPYGFLPSSAPEWGPCFRADLFCYGELNKKDDESAGAWLGWQPPNQFF